MFRLLTEEEYRKLAVKTLVCLWETLRKVNTVKVCTDIFWRSKVLELKHRPIIHSFVRWNLIILQLNDRSISIINACHIVKCNLYYYQAASYGPSDPSKMCSNKSKWGHIYTVFSVEYTANNKSKCVSMGT